MMINRGRHGRSVGRRALAVLAATGLFGTIAAVSPAQAQSPGTPRQTEQAVVRHSSVQQERIAVADSLTDRLGTRAAGFYLDAAGKPVVNVLDAAAAAQVRAKHATPKIVEYSTARLDSVRAAFDRVSAPNTAWGTDPITDQVVVSISRATPKAQAARLTALATSFGDAVRVERFTGTTPRMIRGGDRVFKEGNRTTYCTAGFNGRRNGNMVVLTAGHCTKSIDRWNIGPTVEADFPGTDYGLIRNTTGEGPAEVYAQPGLIRKRATVIGSGDPVVNQEVCSYGATSGYDCGKVLAVDQTRSDNLGRVTKGLTITDIVRDSGDSGGPLFEYNQQNNTAVAIGMLSIGGLGKNHTNTGYQPIRPALEEYGVTLATRTNAEN